MRVRQIHVFGSSGDGNDLPSSAIEASLRKASAGLIIAGCIQVAVCVAIARSGYPAIYLGLACPLFFTLTALGVRRLVASSSPTLWMIVLCGLFAAFSLATTWFLRGRYTGGLNAAEPLIGLGVFGAGLANHLRSWLAGCGLIACHRGALMLAGTGLPKEHAFLVLIECGSLASAAVGSRIVWRQAMKLDGPKVALERDTADDARKGLQVDAARERRRLMHDAPIYHLWLVGENKFVRDSAEFRSGCARDAELLRGTVVLSEPTQSLAEVLNDLVADFKRRGLEVQLSPSGLGASPKDPRVITALKRAVEQALVNVLSHSGRGEAEVIATTTDQGQTFIQVRDRGRGFSQAATSERLGFRYSVEQRMRDVGGDASTQSRPGAGTVVTLCWPR